jgi:hypothetical protein
MLCAVLVAVGLVCSVQRTLAVVQISSVDQIRTLFKDGVLLPGYEDIVLTTHLDLTAATAPSLLPKKGKNVVSSIRVRTCGLLSTNKYLLLNIMA